MWTVEAKDGLVTHKGMPCDLARFIGLRLIYITEMRKLGNYAEADKVRDGLKCEVLLYWYGDLSEFYFEDDAVYDSVVVRTGRDFSAADVEPWWLNNRLDRAKYRKSLRDNSL